MNSIGSSKASRADHARALLGEGESSDAVPRIDLPLVRLGMAFGLVAGLLELLVVHARAWLMQDGLLRKSPEVAWMLPLASVFWLTLLGAGLWVICRVVPRVRSRVAPFVLMTGVCFAVLLSVPTLHSVSCLVLAAGIGAWLVPRSAERRAWLARLVRYSAPICAAVIGVLWFVSGPVPDWARKRAYEPAGPRPADAPNVLLIVMDTVRVDATSLVENPRDTTPVLRGLAERGVKFDRAIAPAPWTLPSHSSLFTGRWGWEVAVGPDRPLDGRFPTLAEALTERGYATAGFAANTVFCTEEYGIARGFGHYEDYPISPLEVVKSSALGWFLSKASRVSLDFVLTRLGLPARHPFEFETERKTAARMNRDVLRWIDGKESGDRPFFVFVNYIDAHDPYLLPWGEPYRFGRTPSSLDDFHTLRKWIGFEANGRDPAKVAFARDAYDSCIRYLDEQIGHLLESLEARGVLENTIVIVTSDHGEHFGEHQVQDLDLFGHRNSLYQPEIRVPLVVFAPHRLPEGVAVAQPVSLRELPATVLDLAGLASAEGIPGESLARWLVEQPEMVVGSEDCDRTAVLAEFVGHTDIPAPIRYQGTPSGMMRALLSGPLVYHRHDDGGVALYNLDRDPGETENIADTELGKAAAAALGAVLDRMAPTGQPVPSSTAD